jgi:chorismate mutase
MLVRGIRGATTVQNNTKEEIISATQELLSEMVKNNQVKIEEVVSVIFSATRDLNAEFPAAAAREMGWGQTPLLCTNEIDVPGSLPKCIRVLMHVNSDREQSEIKHVYLKDAVNLRG